MKADISKDTFVGKKHFRDVRMQQGRVLLCSDWNEQADIVAYRSETTAKDIIGQSGTPMDDHDGNGFKIEPALPLAPQPSLTISAGRFYVDGILCENESDVLFNNQPDAGGNLLDTANGMYIIYLDAWLRNITAAEDTALREVALGGPDTTTRSKVVWQVKSIPEAAANCVDPLPASVINQPTGRLGAKTEESTGSDNPCGLATTGGYKRLENQLYRVEIHNAGDGIDRAHTTFKWSRDNGSVLTRLEKFESGNKLTVHNPGKDELLNFKKDNWVELVNDTTDLQNWPGILVKLSDVKGNVLTINTSAATLIDHKGIGLAAICDLTKNPRVRRWDSPGGEMTVNPVDGTWLDLEDGVQVSFFQQPAEKYHNGDYWLIPARTATPRIDFTEPELPRGIKHHFAKLAIAELTAAGWSVRSDCRPVFPSLTDLISLHYVGGDGQEAMPGSSLPDTLKVGVANGKWAIENAKVRFEFLTGTGTLTPLNGGLTGPDGIAHCNWQLSNSIVPGQKLQVRASLLNDKNDPVPDILPVIFNASVNVATNVSYDGGDCTKWDIPMPATVADTLTSLCKRGNKKGCTVSVGKGAQFGTLEEAYDSLKEGETDLCICLLPETHTITKDIFSSKSLKTLKIAGCGAIIKVKIKDLTFAAENIIFQGFSLSPVDENKEASIILNCKELHMDYCEFTCLQSEFYRKTPFIEIKTFKNAEGNIHRTVVHLNNNKIAVNHKPQKPPEGRVLALDFMVGGWIENNEIEGDLLLQYGDPFKKLNWDGPPPPALRNAIENGLGNNLKLTGDTILNMCNNILFCVQTNAMVIMKNQDSLDKFLKPSPLLDPLEAFKDIVISENVFSGFPNSFIAESLSMKDNHFTSANDRISSYALGYKGVFMGNIGETSDGGIDTIFDRKIINKAFNLIKIQ